jgi:hypothetical protein
LKNILKGEKMKMVKQYIIALSAVILTCNLTATSAEKQGTDSLQLQLFGVSTLKDVQSVYPKVSLEIIDANDSEPNFVPQIGLLTQKELQKNLEQMLKLSGITITNKFNATSANSPLSLNANVFARAIPNTLPPVFAVFVNTEAMQGEALFRDSKIRLYSRTWPMVPTGSATRAFLFVTPETIVKEITNEVTRQVRSFLIDYSAANLKKQTKTPATKPPAEKPPVEKKPEQKPTEQKPAQKQPVPAPKPKSI